MSNIELSELCRDRDWDTLREVTSDAKTMERAGGAWEKETLDDFFDRRAPDFRAILLEGKCVGVAGVEVGAGDDDGDGAGDGELLLLVAPDVAGRGVGTVAARSALEAYRSKNPGVRVHALVGSGNVAMNKVAQKAGLQLARLTLRHGKVCSDYSDAKVDGGLIADRHQYHLDVHKKFLGFLHGSLSPEDLVALRKTIHADRNKQWARAGGVNIITHKTNCPQLCRYCYNLAWKHRKGTEIPDIEDLRAPFVTDAARVRKFLTWTKRRAPELRIASSTHDIFPEMLGDFVAVVRHIITVTGGEFLIVTKPRLECVRALCDRLGDLAKSVMFVFTISSDDEKTLGYWEPHAPGFPERLESLKVAFYAGFRTSVSMEPYISDPRPVVAKVRPYVTHAIWLGEMNYCKVLKFDPEEYSKIEGLYTRAYVRLLVDEYAGDDKVFFKYSVMRKAGLKGMRS